MNVWLGCYPKPFGTKESMLTLFLSITGGLSWTEALEPLRVLVQGSWHHLDVIWGFEMIWTPCDHVIIDVDRLKA